jgi:hypothetical protein
MSRSIRVTGKARIRTDRSVGHSRSSSFVRGLLGGLSAATQVYGEHGPRRYSGGGLGDDWRAVGGDIQTAIDKYGK